MSLLHHEINESLLQDLGRRNATWFKSQDLPRMGVWLNWAIDSFCRSFPATGRDFWLRQDFEQ